MSIRHNGKVISNTNIIDGIKIHGIDVAVDTNKIVDLSVLEQFDVLPVASADNTGRVVQYVGSTNSSYTHGYVYESKVSGEASSVMCTGTDSETLFPPHIQIDKEVFETKITTEGEYMFHYDGTEWTLDGISVNLEDYGISIDPGITYSSGDNVYILYTESTLSYFWSAIPVQPEAGIISNAEIDEMWSDE